MSQSPRRIYIPIEHDEYAVYLTQLLGLRSVSHLVGFMIKNYGPHLEQWARSHPGSSPASTPSFQPPSSTDGFNEPITGI